jgi:hypothetical protein
MKRIPIIGLLMAILLTVACQKKSDDLLTKNQNSYTLKFGVGDAENVTSYTVYTGKDGIFESAATITPNKTATEYNVVLILDVGTQVKVKAVENNGESYESDVAIASN